MRFTLFLLIGGSRPKTKHKAGASNKEVDGVRRRANLLLIQQNEVVGVDQLKDPGSKFLGRVCIQAFQQTRG